MTTIIEIEDDVIIEILKDGNKARWGRFYWLEEFIGKKLHIKDIKAIEDILDELERIPAIDAHDTLSSVVVDIAAEK